MKLETMREQVRGVAKRWRMQYGTGRSGQDKQKLCQTLDCLDTEAATAEDVAAIIGNDSWVCAPECSECGAQTYRAVEIGQPLDYESRTATICIDCLRKAVALIESSDATLTA